MQVYWYPRGNKDSNTVPRVGSIAIGWSKGVADISIMPANDGAVDYMEHVYHIGDPRNCDHFGKPSPNILHRGFWEFSPMSLAVMEMEKLAAPAAAPVEVVKPETKKTKVTA